jgi:hypothetical protein
VRFWKECKKANNDNKIIRSGLVGTNSTNKEGEVYIRQLHQHMTNNNIFKKSEFLHSNVSEGTIDRLMAINILDKMDDLITKVMIKAERDKCSKKERVLWTLMLTLQKQQICIDN